MGRNVCPDVESVVWPGSMSLPIGSTKRAAWHEPNFSVKYLPVPLLLLSESKKVVFANDAMSALLSRHGQRVVEGCLLQEIGIHVRRRRRDGPPGSWDWQKPLQNVDSRWTVNGAEENETNEQISLSVVFRESRCKRTCETSKSITRAEMVLSPWRNGSQFYYMALFTRIVRCDKHNNAQKAKRRPSSTTARPPKTAIQSKQSPSVHDNLYSILRHARATLWVVDRRRRLTLLEGHFADELAPTYDAAAECGNNIYDLCRKWTETDVPNETFSFSTPLETVMEGRSSMELVEHGFRGKWYRSRYVPMYGQEKAIGGKGEIEGVICISTDITELRDRQEETKRQEEENLRLRAEDAALKHVAELKSQFLANMSHELRNPLTGILGMAELIQDSNLDHDQMKHLNYIQRSAETLLTLLNDVLAFSEIESDRFHFSDKDFNLKTAVGDVCTTVSPLAKKKGLRWTQRTIESTSPTNCLVRGDAVRVRQILNNVLTNSIKFTTRGFVSLDCSTQERGSGNVEARFEIRDSGIGMSQETLDGLFQPFNQADNSAARKFGGAGLGLAICKRLVDRMNGSIAVQSTVQVGTTVTISIPFRRGNSQPLNDDLRPTRHLAETQKISVIPSIKIKVTQKDTSHIDHSRRHDNQSLAGLKSNIFILVVEDNAINQQIALKTIRKLGLRCAAVWNGQEAIEFLLDTGNIKPDLILMDIQMPLVDGYEATRMIRNSPVLKKARIPIVALTASTIPGDEEKCILVGMDDYLTKPLRPKVLETTVLKWVS